MKFKLFFTALFLIPPTMTALAQSSDEHSEAPDKCAVVIQELDFIRPIQVKVRNYYLEHRAWPTTNAQVGLPKPSEIQSTGISAVVVSANGIITIVFNSLEPAGNSTLSLIPRILQHEIIEWRTNASFNINNCFLK